MRLGGHMGGPRLLGCKLTLPRPRLHTLLCPVPSWTLHRGLLGALKSMRAGVVVCLSWFLSQLFGARLGSPSGGVSFIHSVLSFTGVVVAGRGRALGDVLKRDQQREPAKASLQAVGSARGKRQGMSPLGLAEGLVPRTGRGCAVTIWQELWSWQESHSHANPQTSKVWPREPTPWPLSTLTL